MNIRYLLLLYLGRKPPIIFSMQILEAVSMFYLRNSCISQEGKLILTCVIPNLHSK